MQLKRVVVTGIGALTPIGNTAGEFWTNLVNGVSGAGPITRFDATNYKTRFACEVKNFDPSQFIDKKEVRRLDRFAQFAMVSSTEAILDSGLDKEGVNKDRIGVIWGSGIGGLDVFIEEITNLALNPIPRFNPFFIPKMIIDIAAGHISMKWGFRGPNYATVAACASSNIAFMDAFNLIRLGKCNAIVAGGSEAPISEGGIGGFNAMRAMSERNDSPETASRPFDKDRDGLIPSGGAATLIIESLESAQKRGAKILGEIIGYGFSSNGEHISNPNVEGQVRSLDMAIKQAGIQTKDVDYINAHATSTPIGDKFEAQALYQFFGDHTPVSSTKSMTGHECWMAGASEIIYSLLMMHNDFIAPNINFENPDEDSAKLDIVATTREAKIDCFLSNSFGFGGTNSTLIIKKFAP